jgi:hypothetical protein
MAIPNIHIDASSDKPYASVPRQIGKHNAGVYCNQCREFFALAVVDRPLPVKFVSNGKPVLQCTECGDQQRRDPSEIVWVVLSPANQRKP